MKDGPEKILRIRHREMRWTAGTEETQGCKEKIWNHLLESRKERTGEWDGSNLQRISCS